MKRNTIFNIFLNVFNFTLILISLEKITFNLFEKESLFFYIQVYSLIGIFISFKFLKKFNWNISLNSFFILLIVNLVTHLVYYKNLSILKIIGYIIFYYFLYEYTFYKIENNKEKISLNDYFFKKNRILNIILCVLILSNFTIEVINITYRIFYDDILFLYILISNLISLLIFYINKYKFKYETAIFLFILYFGIYNNLYTSSLNLKYLNYDTIKMLSFIFFIAVCIITTKAEKLINEKEENDALKEAKKLIEEEKNILK